MVNQIISKYGKLAQKKYKTRYDWMGKVIYWELCKRLKFEQVAKWYMLELESLIENEIHKILMNILDTNR